MIKYRIKFPAIDPHQLDQDKAYFILSEKGGDTVQIRFHDYDEIYRRPGLYEQLFYERLKSVSPEKVVNILGYAARNSPTPLSEFRVLDLGAGNGMVAEELRKRGVARIVGVDISAPAMAAAKRDRPSVYDEYYAFDMGQMDDPRNEELAEWKFNCLISVAALGFGDIPVRVFRAAFNLIEDGGWIAFNIKETFFDRHDTSGFSVFIRELLLSEYLTLHHIDRYRHRLSIDGRALYYFGVAGCKIRDIAEVLD